MCDKNLGEYQLCPKCLGSGQMNPPQGSTCMFCTCDVCDGAKIIARPQQSACFFTARPGHITWIDA